MNDQIKEWWDRRNAQDRVIITVAGGLVVVAIGGAVAYAIATGGMVATATVGAAHIVVAVGKAASGKAA